MLIDSIDEEIKLYAPVVIPTLHRKEHLEKCIESLQDNILAQYTDLFISLDYPLNDEKYIEGYKEVKKYLQKNIEGFRKVIIYEQKTNLGLCGNMNFLYDTVFSQYDRLIWMEDDCTCSCNFLEYMNKGLQIFEKDKSIVSVCGALPPAKRDNTIIEEGNIVRVKGFSAYGVGVWKDKYINYKNKINRQYFNYIARHNTLVSKIQKESTSTFFAYVSALLKREKVYIDSNGDIPCFDQMITVYCSIEEKFSIFQNQDTPLVICNGYDGSGENSPCENNTNIELDRKEKFDYKISTNIAIRKQIADRDAQLNIKLRVFYSYVKIWIFNMKNFKR